MNIFNNVTETNQFDYNERVAIIIPTYNRFLFLKKALLSCINQTYDKIDIFITDDSSTKDILEQDIFINDLIKTHVNIKYLKNDINVGFCMNINRALKLIQDKHFFYILFDDDWIENTYIETAVNLFKLHDNIDFVEFNALNHISDTYFTSYNPYYSSLTNINNYMLKLTNGDIIYSCVSPGNRVFKNINILFDEYTIVADIDNHCLKTGSGYDFIFIYNHLKVYKNFYF
jgi:glycosyltransferase involved in cell wall biosynthesis